MIPAIPAIPAMAAMAAMAAPGATASPTRCPGSTEEVEPPLTTRSTTFVVYACSAAVMAAYVSRSWPTSPRN